jgi:hypothetical protein
MSSAAKGLVSLPEADRESAFQTLFKIIDNVIAAPTDVKKRRLKKGNEVFQQKVGRHDAAMIFLRASGFVDGDDPDAGEEGRNTLLTMPVAFIVRLTDAHHSLAAAAEQAWIPAPPLPVCPVFNPYASHTQGVDPTRQVKAPSAYSAEIARIGDERKAREAALKAKVDDAAPVPLRPSVFWAASGRRLEEVLREHASEVEAEPGDNALIGSQIGNVKGALAGNQKFENAEKRALAELSRKRVHETSIIRITCPDKSVLQVHFRSADKGEYVIAQIQPLLAPHIQAASWYIYQSPPMKRLVARETLLQAGMSPGAHLYLGFDGDKPGAPYFEASLQAQLGAPPEDQARGVNAVAGPSFSGEAMGWGVGQRLGGPSAAAPPKAVGADGSSAAVPNASVQPVPMQVE